MTLGEIAAIFVALHQGATYSWRTREAFEHLSQACMSCIFFDFRVILFSASLQECGDGAATKDAAAKESLRDLGYDGLHVAIRGGFLSLLKDIWFQEHKYSAVTLVWAGNDLTSRWSTPDTFTHAVEEVMATAFPSVSWM